MTTKCLMIQGTGSGVGKSVITAAFCRRLYLDGHKVAPFKAQNMSLNSFVTEDGGEMGRAQVYQAQACGIKPHVAMNPILLKPCGDNLSQVIVMGKVTENRNAKDYYRERKVYESEVRAAFNYLVNRYDWIILEGAGSPAEINLKKYDFVNMPMAKQANAQVLVVGDIDRGGVFAWMKGTFDLLDKSERNLIQGFIINKFRGDIDILKPGIEMFENQVGKPVMGVIPFYRDLFVDEEDSTPFSLTKNSHLNTLDIVVIRLPRISNFTDVSPLLHETNVTVRYVWKENQLGNPDLVIIPGSKNTLEDTEFLQSQNLDRAILQCSEKKSVLLGICGGFQMMGKAIHDPDHLESRKETIFGLGLFDFETTLISDKTTKQVSGFTKESPIFPKKLPVEGYEIHMGVSDFHSKYPKLLSESNDLVSSSICNNEGTVIGTYIHGFLDSDPLRKSFLNFVRRKRGLPEEYSDFDFQNFKEEQLDRLAQIIEDHIDMKRIYKLFLLVLLLKPYHF